MQNRNNWTGVSNNMNTTVNQSNPTMTEFQKGYPLNQINSIMYNNNFQNMYPNQNNPNFYPQSNYSNYQGTHSNMMNPYNMNSNMPISTTDNMNNNFVGRDISSLLETQKMQPYNDRQFLCRTFNFRVPFIQAFLTLSHQQKLKFYLCVEQRKLTGQISQLFKYKQILQKIAQIVNPQLNNKKQHTRQPITEEEIKNKILQNQVDKFCDEELKRLGVNVHQINQEDNDDEFGQFNQYQTSFNNTQKPAYPLQNQQQKSSQKIAKNILQEQQQWEEGQISNMVQSNKIDQYHHSSINSKQNQKSKSKDKVDSIWDLQINMDQVKSVQPDIKTIFGINKNNFNNNKTASNVGYNQLLHYGQQQKEEQQFQEYNSSYQHQNNSNKQQYNQNIQPQLQILNYQSNEFSNSLNNDLNFLKGSNNLIVRQQLQYLSDNKKQKDKMTSDLLSLQHVIFPSHSHTTSQSNNSQIVTNQLNLFSSLNIQSAEDKSNEILQMNRVGKNNIQRSAPVILLNCFNSTDVQIPGNNHKSITQQMAMKVNKQNLLSDNIIDIDFGYLNDNTNQSNDIINSQQKPYLSNNQIDVSNSFYNPLHIQHPYHQQQQQLQQEKQSQLSNNNYGQINFQPVNSYINHSQTQVKQQNNVKQNKQSQEQQWQEGQFVEATHNQNNYITDAQENCNQKQMRFIEINQNNIFNHKNQQINYFLNTNSNNNPISYNYINIDPSIQSVFYQPLQSTQFSYHNQTTLSNNNVNMNNNCDDFDIFNFTNQEKPNITQNSSYQNNNQQLINVIQQPNVKQQQQKVDYQNQTNNYNIQYQQFGSNPNKKHLQQTNYNQLDTIIQNKSLMIDNNSTLIRTTYNKKLHSLEHKQSSLSSSILDNKSHHIDSLNQALSPRKQISSQMSLDQKLIQNSHIQNNGSYIQTVKANQSQSYAKKFVINNSQIAIVKQNLDLFRKTNKLVPFIPQMLVNYMKQKVNSKKYQFEPDFHEKLIRILQSFSYIDEQIKKQLSTNQYNNDQHLYEKEINLIQSQINKINKINQLNSKFTKAVEQDEEDKVVETLIQSKQLCYEVTVQSQKILTIFNNINLGNKYLPQQTSSQLNNQTNKYNNILYHMSQILIMMNVKYDFIQSLMCLYENNITSQPHKRLFVQISTILFFIASKQQLEYLPNIIKTVVNYLTQQHKTLMSKLQEIKQLSLKHNKSPQQIFGQLIKSQKMITFLKGLYSIAVYAERLLKLNKLLGNKLLIIQDQTLILKAISQSKKLAQKYQFVQQKYLSQTYNSLALPKNFMKFFLSQVMHYGNTHEIQKIQQATNNFIQENPICKLCLRVKNNQQNDDNGNWVQKDSQSKDWCHYECYNILNCCFNVQSWIKKY